LKKFLVGRTNTRATTYAHRGAPALMSSARRNTNFSSSWLSNPSYSGVKVPSNSLYSYTLFNENFESQWTYSKKQYFCSTAPANLEAVFVSDGASGQTAAIVRAVQGHFYKEYKPTVLENYLLDVSLDGVKHNLHLWETAGQEEYDKTTAYRISWQTLFCHRICCRLARLSRQRSRQGECLISKIYLCALWG